MDVEIKMQWVRKSLVFVLALGCLSGAVAFTFAVLHRDGDGELPRIEAPYLRVSVVEGRVQPVRVEVTARGQVGAKYETTLVSEVTARVSGVSDSLAGGCFVKAGELLATLDDTDCRRGVALAEKELAAARVSLLQEERRARQAKMEWKRSRLSGEPDSPLLLRQPQLASARASVTAARAALAWAKKQLDSTRIRAPFDGVVIRRSVSPGSYLQAGQKVASLYASDGMEVRLFLSSGQWKLMPSEEELVSGTWPVTLADGTGETWRGVVSRVEHHADPVTRQRALVVRIGNRGDKGPRLMPGIFVQATLSGKVIERAMVLPQSSMTSGGDVWFVKKDNTLDRYRPKLLYRSGKQIYVLPPEKADRLTVLRVPQSSYLPGMRVRVEGDTVS